MRASYVPAIFEVPWTAERSYLPPPGVLLTRFKTNWESSHFSRSLVYPPRSFPGTFERACSLFRPSKELIQKGHTQRNALFWSNFWPRARFSKARQRKTRCSRVIFGSRPLAGHEHSRVHFPKSLWGLQGHRETRCFGVIFGPKHDFARPDKGKRAVPE